MAINFSGYQPSRYVVGKLELASGEKKQLTEATFEGPEGLLDAPPANLRGWVITVKSGTVEFAPSESSTLSFASPSNALNDSEASNLTGLWAFEKASGAAVVTIWARIGGVG